MKTNFVDKYGEICHKKILWIDKIMDLWLNMRLENVEITNLVELVVIRLKSISGSF